MAKKFSTPYIAKKNTTVPGICFLDLSAKGQKQKTIFSEIHAVLYSMCNFFHILYFTFTGNHSSVLGGAEKCEAKKNAVPTVFDLPEHLTVSGEHDLQLCEFRKLRA